MGEVAVELFQESPTAFLQVGGGFTSLSVTVHAELCCSSQR